MEQLKLTHQEQTFYGECFQTCDADGNGRITSSRASDLFMYSGLSPEVLLQVWLYSRASNLCIYSGLSPEVLLQVLLYSRAKTCLFTHDLVRKYSYRYDFTAGLLTCLCIDINTLYILPNMHSNLKACVQLYIM
jgi:hypothetical protein